MFKNIGQLIKYWSDKLYVLHSLPLSFKPKEFYWCSKVIRLALEVHKYSYSIGTWGYFPGSKVAER
jgi:hypothetical protein